MDPTGAAVAGGRWNQKGVPVVYASSTLSLSCLEILVHIKEPRLPADYVWVRIDIPAELLSEPLAPSEPADEFQCRLMGTEWARHQRSAAVEVPSVIIPIENNVLLNPAHPQFPEIAVSQPVRFRFDPRLLKLGPASLWEPGMG
jgi:RES domain-containing protein